MFAIGASDAYVDMGMSEKDAEAVAEEMCKLAAKRYVVDDDDDDEEEDTWWSRNRGWLIPAAIGTGAFLLGSNASSSEYAIPGGGHFENAGRYVWNKLRKLFGYSDDPIWKSLTEVSARPPSKPHTNLAAEFSGKFRNGGYFDHDGTPSDYAMKEYAEYIKGLPTGMRNRAEKHIESLSNQK